MSTALQRKKHLTCQTSNTMCFVQAAGTYLRILSCCRETARCKLYLTLRYYSKCFCEALTDLKYYNTPPPPGSSPVRGSWCVVCAVTLWPGLWGGIWLMPSQTGHIRWKHNNCQDPLGNMMSLHLAPLLLTVPIRANWGQRHCSLLLQDLLGPQNKLNSTQ